MSGVLSVIVGLIFALILLGVLWWAAQQLLPMIPMAEPMATIVRVLVTVLGVVVVLWVLAVLLGLAGVKVPYFSGRTAQPSVRTAAVWREVPTRCEGCGNTGIPAGRYDVCRDTFPPG